MRVRIGNLSPCLVYALLSIAILAPLLSPGYILTLDMAFGPGMDFISRIYGLDEWWPSICAPLWILLELATDLVPAWLVEKAILFLALFLAGLGAHRLLPFNGPGRYFAGLLYMINPFVYVRFLAGQWALLAAYALIPFAVKAFIDLMERGDNKDAIKVAIFSTMVGVMTIQALFLLFLVYLTLFVAKLIRGPREWDRIVQVGKVTGISAAIFLALNLYWLVPIFTGGGVAIEQIGRQDLLFFSPKPTSGLGIMFDIASMYGFWRGGYIYAQDLMPLWWLPFIFILFLAVYGFVCRFRGQTWPHPNHLHSGLGWVVVSFGVVGVVSFLLAVGAASEFTSPPFEWLWEHLLFFRGLRDSQKFVALLCLVYAYLGGLGVDELVKGWRERRKMLTKVAMTALIALALLTPATYSFTMFGLHGQLGVTDYPREWYEVNDYLNQDEEDFNVLFLPWHQYMDYSWLPNRDKRLAEPAPQFFDKPIIAGDNIEVPGIYSQSANPVSKYVEFLLANASNVNNLGELLAPLNVKYVILVHEVDYKLYDFLYQQEDLVVELEKPGITLFRNEHPVARIYGVDSVVYVNSLDEYIELSLEQDVMEHLYILNSDPSSDGGGDMQRLDFTANSPVRYRVEGGQTRYTIFTVPQSVATEHWRYDGEQSLRNLGFMPAFESDEGGGEIVYIRFYHVYLPSYIISLVALGLTVGYCLFRGNRRRGS